MLQIEPYNWEKYHKKYQSVENKHISIAWKLRNKIHNIYFGEILILIGV